MTTDDYIIDQAEQVTRLKKQVDQLREALRSTLGWMEFTIPRLHTTPTGSIERMNWGGLISKARKALEETAL